MCIESIIDADAVLTAAHCLAPSAADPLARVVEAHDTTPARAAGVTIHPLWNDDVGDGHDLAVVRMPDGSTARIDPVVVGAPLDPRASAPRNEATTIGHDATHDDGAPTAELREVQIPTRSDGYMSDTHDPWWWAEEWIQDLCIGACSTDRLRRQRRTADGATQRSHGTDRRVQLRLPRHAYDFDACDVPGAFSELDGPAFAWPGVTVPGIQQRWSSCLDGPGAPTTGRPTVSCLADTQFHQELSTTRCDTGAPPPGPFPNPLARQCRPPNRNTCEP